MNQHYYIDSDPNNADPSAIVIRDATGLAVLTPFHFPTSEYVRTATLAMRSMNAFAMAAERLGVDPLELAEVLGNGKLAGVLLALRTSCRAEASP